MPTPSSTSNVAITSYVPSSVRSSRVFTTSSSLAHSLLANIPHLHPMTLAHQQRRRAEGCTISVETQTWLPPDFDTCSMHLAEVACNDLVLTGACHPNPVAPPGATSISTSAHTSSSNFPPYLASLSNNTPSGGRSGLKLGLGVCFGVLGIVLVVALFIACVTRLQRHPQNLRTQHLPPKTLPRPFLIRTESQPPPAPRSASPISGSFSSPSSSASSRPLNNSWARDRHLPKPGSVDSDLTSITWSSEGRHDRISNCRNTVPAGGQHAANQRIRQADLPNNLQRGGNEWVRQWVGANAVVDVPVAAVIELEQIQHAEAQGFFLRQARVFRENNAGAPAAPPTANGRVGRKRVHFQPTVEDVDESVG